MAVRHSHRVRSHLPCRMRVEPCFENVGLLLSGCDADACHRLLSQEAGVRKVPDFLQRVCLQTAKATGCIVHVSQDDLGSKVGSKYTRMRLNHPI
jgi:hypothetical protein